MLRDMDTTWKEYTKCMLLELYGRGENACGKWFKGGETSGSWTLTKQAFKDHFRSRAFYSGLINMSDDLVNVCYQNSVMQCLYNSEFFREKIFRQLWGRCRHFG